MFAARRKNECSAIVCSVAGEATFFLPVRRSMRDIEAAHVACRDVEARAAGLWGIGLLLRPALQEPRSECLPQVVVLVVLMEHGVRLVLLVYHVLGAVQGHRSSGHIAACPHWAGQEAVDVDANRGRLPLTIQGHAVARPLPHEHVVDYFVRPLLLAERVLHQIGYHRFDVALHLESGTHDVTRRQADLPGMASEDLVAEVLQDD
mmetsp:Transcript_45102/g.125038  ORF Transcript_45102/g.125038 Transcript_45102/m.125038 type:complete len:205 (-) Transcript_45102:829-1443(-)